MHTAMAPACARLLGLWILFGLGAVFAQPAPVVTVLRASPPQIDGDLDDDCWEEGPILTGFTVPEELSPAPKPVTARIAFDDSNLYLAIDSAEPHPERLRARHQEDDPDVWQDDCVEVFLRAGSDARGTDHTAVDQLIVNAAGARWSLHHRASGFRPWPPDWPAAVAVYADRWTAELAVPLAAIGVHTATGRLVELKLGREDATGGETVLSVWPPGSSYGGADGYGRLYLGESNRLGDPPPSAAFSRDLDLLPFTPYELSAQVRSLEPVAATARSGEAGPEFRRAVRGGDAWRSILLAFATGADSQTTIALDAAPGAALEVRQAQLLQVPRLDALGPAIPVPADGEPLVVTDLAIADTRVVRGFVGTPFDGTVRSRGWDSQVWEYPEPGGGAGVSYAAEGNDGLHVILADGDGFDAIQVRGGIRADLVGDGPGTPRIHAFGGNAVTSRALFDERVYEDHVSFYEVRDGLLAEVSFFRVGRVAPDGHVVASWRTGVHGTSAVAGERSHLLEATGGGAPLALAAGEAVRLVGPVVAVETPLAALELRLRADRAPVPLRVTVHDGADPRLDLMSVDVELTGVGATRLVLDVVDQVEPAGWRAQLTLESSEPVTLWGIDAGGPELVLVGIDRDVAVRQALPYRLFLLKSFFACASEPRPWTGLRRDTDMAAWFAREPWGDQVRQLFETAAHARRLDPGDDTARQYDEWLWRGKRGLAPYEPAVTAPPGAPEWAVWVRAAWLEARAVAAWWLEHRLAATGEFGGLVGDDTDLYQNFVDLPFLESGGVAARLIDGGARLAELAELDNLEAGINRRTMDPLHAYEEGLNQEALMAAWHYGDPVYLERCMAAARSAEGLTTVTSIGHRHFRSQRVGVSELGATALDRDGQAHPQMWHPAFEVLWYSRNPRVERVLREWADGWLEHMESGRYATLVDVAAERVVETTDRPLYGGYGGLGSAFAFLAWNTGDTRYLGPFLEAYAAGGDGTSPQQLLPELLLRYGRDAILGASPRLQPAGAAATILTGDPAPLVEALRQDVAELQRFRVMYTSAEPFTDRIFLDALSNAAIAGTGGFARRNKFNRSHAVSWGGFSTEYAALVLDASPRRFRALLHAFGDTELFGSARFWSLDHGIYSVRAGVDADGDGQADGPAPARRVEIVRGEPLAVRLAPHAVTVLELDLLEASDDLRSRPDLALSPLDLEVGEGAVRGVAHSVGAAAAPCAVALVDGAGRQVARRELGRLEAPFDLQPRRAIFAFEGLPRRTRGWRVVVDPDGAVVEIDEANNVVSLEAALATAARRSQVMEALANGR